MELCKKAKRGEEPPPNYLTVRYSYEIVDAFDAADISYD